MKPWIVATVLVIALVATAPRAAAMTEDEAYKAMSQALLPYTDVGAQVQTLVELAWTKPGVDPALRAMARKTLGEFGETALPGLAQALARVDKSYTADVLKALLETASGAKLLPPALMSGLREVLWTGSSEARRIAIPELAKQHDRLSLLVMIDNAEEDPSLLPVVVPALGELHDDRARFFLAEQLVKGKPAIQEQTALALARIGGRALEPLRDALRSSNRTLRLTAARAILPVATDADLSALYEYIAAYPTDDPPTIAAIKDVCVAIEQAVEARRASEAASAPQDF